MYVAFQYAAFATFTLSVLNLENCQFVLLFGGKAGGVNFGERNVSRVAGRDIKLAHGISPLLRFLLVCFDAVQLCDASTITNIFRLQNAMSNTKKFTADSY